MAAVIAQLKTLWGQLGTPQKLVIGGLTVLVVAALVAAVAMGGRTEYRVLATGLARDEAQKLLTSLDDAGIAYRIGNGGRDVEVDAESWSKVQGMVVKNDLLPGDALKGWGGLDKLGFGLTEKQQQLKMRVALEEQLALTLMQLDGIERATVHVTPARRSWNRRDSRPAKASVTVHARPGRILNQNQVSSVRQIVAHAVEGLETGDVAVIDARGIPLSAPEDGDEATAVDLKIRNSEEYLQAKAESALAMAFGEGRAVVRVDVDVNRERIEETSSKIVPDSKVTMKEIITNEQNTGSSEARGEVSAAAVATAKKPSGSQLEKIDAEYAYETRKETRIRPAGEVRRITVGVLVDEALSQKAAEITKLVKGAVGFTPQRDSLEVAFVPFAEKPAPEAPPEPSFMDDALVLDGVRWGVSLLVGIGILVALMRSAKKAREGLQEVIRERQQVEMAMEAPEEEEEEEPKPDPRQEIVDAVDEDVDTVAKLLRGWLYEPAGR